MKPLGCKSYGSIGHLPGSRLGPGDHCINPGQARILTESPRDKHDVIIVTEKLDGSNVAVANIDGTIVPLTRSGYVALSSPYEQHHMFSDWVCFNLKLFEFLKPGERVCGEWLAQAHGTKYNKIEMPFVAFDLFLNKTDRALYEEFSTRTTLWIVPVISVGSTTIQQVNEILDGKNRYYASDSDGPEGAVWRVERKGKVDFLGKYVRTGKVDGKYLPEINGGEATWNWKL